MKKRHAPPKAAAMIEALRGLGYSTATALADIIDNSISAGAKNVNLRFLWNGDRSHISVQDDGHGMDSDTLDRAMRLGERNPNDQRHASDLGRFGLGLKTASFSQCRCLTVASIAQQGLQCLRWDLDLLEESSDDGWYMLEGPKPGAEILLESLVSAGRGTLVLWQILDRIVTPGYKEQDFLDLVDQVERHLSMVFHRYLEGGNPKLRLLINGQRLSPWDPFLTGHPAKPWHSPGAAAPSAPNVLVECHVLPHKDRLSNKEYVDAQGPDGWTAQQGFYVYRNQRLLVAGSWLGLGQGRSWTKDEAHRLARIRLDIPNSVDADWKIDIRKSTARPPVAIRPWLVLLAEATRSRARKAFAHRGRPAIAINGGEVTQAWRSQHFTGGMRYRIDPDHPAVRAVLDDSGALLPAVKAMLRVLEETIPVQRIWLDTAETKETPRTGFDATPTNEVITVLETMYRAMIEKKGMSPELAKERLVHTEPFHNYPQLIAALPE